MWWNEIADLERHLSWQARDWDISPDAIVEEGAILDASRGRLQIDRGARICRGAMVQGPGTIGSDALIGANVFLRGPFVIERGARIGYASEVKNALVRSGACIGPMCFVADSLVEEDAYLGAMVRTSNQRLDRRPIRVFAQGEWVETGLGKLGCRIGAKAALGIQVIVLPGRVVEPETVFEPRLTVDRNYPVGHYRALQQIQIVRKEPCL